MKACFGRPSFLPAHPRRARAYRGRDFYIAGFSSRKLSGQDLDLGTGRSGDRPYQLQTGQTSWFVLNGALMAASPVTQHWRSCSRTTHLLTQAEAETVLESSAIRMKGGCRNVALYLVLGRLRSAGLRRDGVENRSMRMQRWQQRGNWNAAAV